ncbi:MAG: M1 family metallopeptidase [Bacteroidales bacterium]|nr:M1 family metallopeptidase [Bacteroidales bacterium]MBN2699544.1 M1 family metallopeptidase [Bacteroidales bacterium]
MKRLIFIIIASLLFNSCAILRYPDFGKVPKKPGSYPKFSERDYLVGKLDEDRAGYDVTFYDLDLFLNPDNKKLGGTVNIHFTALAELKNIRFDLYENLDISSLKISGQEISFLRNDRAVIASLPASLVIGRDYILVVEYEGKPSRAKNPPWSGGVVWERDKDGNPWIGVTCETEGGSIWFPCKDHLSDEPDSVRLRMTVPAGLQVVSNGTMKSHIFQSAWETFTWSTNYPVNIYNITFYAGKFEHFSDTMHTPQGILNLDYYVLPQNLEKAKKHFIQAKDVINIYIMSFGPYPWMKEGFRLVEAPYEGMEHQTAIAYGSRYSNRAWLGGDYIIVHEAAHEWWGNAVSVIDFSDIWLHEGFATYSEMIFAEHTLGYDNSLLYARYYIAGSIKNKRPVVGPPDVSYWNNRDNDIYNKGAMVLHTIRNVLNDSALFFDILQTFYRENTGSSHVVTADFIEVVERKTGKDWDKFFEVYLYSREVPVLYWYYGSVGKNEDYGTNVRKGVPVVAAKWVNVPEGFSMPVELYCKKENVSVRIEVTTKPTLFYFEDMTTCIKLICNKKLSYFDAVTDISVLTEVESYGPGDK